MRLSQSPVINMTHALRGEVSLIRATASREAPAGAVHSFLRAMPHAPRGCWMHAGEACAWGGARARVEASGDDRFAVIRAGIAKRPNPEAYNMTVA